MREKVFKLFWAHNFFFFLTRPSLESQTLQIVFQLSTAMGDKSLIFIVAVQRSSQNEQ